MIVQAGDEPQRLATLPKLILPSPKPSHISDL
jgi:hypothetical protein